MAKTENFNNIKLIPNTFLSTGTSGVIVRNSAKIIKKQTNKTKIYHN